MLFNGDVITETPRCCKLIYCLLSPAQPPGCREGLHCTPLEPHLSVRPQKGAAMVKIQKYEVCRNVEHNGATSDVGLRSPSSRRWLLSQHRFCTNTKSRGVSQYSHPASFPTSSIACKILSINNTQNLWQHEVPVHSTLPSSSCTPTFSEKLGRTRHMKHLDSVLALLSLPR